jgi:acyl-CoA reductase-like NAD-dependent aldehyde dehydrogenase
LTAAGDVLRSYVGGRWTGGEELREDLNPARPSTTIALVATADEALAEAAVAAAREAFGAWRALAPARRGDMLYRIGALLEARADELGRELALEEGKTTWEATLEARRAGAIFRYHAGETLQPDGETFASNLASLLYMRREPVGVVTVITPWNFPLAIPAWKIAPALAYGNTVVWKPAEIVPLLSVRLAEIGAEAGLPAGVLNLVLGSGTTVGGTIVEAPAVDAVTFTGSNAVGRGVQEAATRAGKRVQLELGGKNPAVVLADASLTHAAEQIARGAFLSAGQKCTATSRVIVERSVGEELAERLCAIASAWKVGDPVEPDTMVGPLSSKEQLARVVDFLGAGEGTPLAGGKALDTADGGYYVPPTVFSDVPPDGRLAREEIFGPVVALLEVDSYEEAVASANDTPYGLSASVFTKDLDRALDFANEIRAGVVKINQESAGVELHVPFGGMKASSSGPREQGKAAREFFTQSKTVYVGKSE